MHTFLPSFLNIQRLPISAVNMSRHFNLFPFLFTFNNMSNESIILPMEGILDHVKTIKFFILSLLNFTTPNLVSKLQYELSVRGLLKNLA